MPSPRGTSHEHQHTFMTASRENIPRIKGVSRKGICREHQNVFLCSITFSRNSCRLWDNVENCGTARRISDDKIIRSMRTAWFITKATLRICNNYCFFTATVVRPKRLNITLYVQYIACLVFIYLITYLFFTYLFIYLFIYLYIYLFIYIYLLIYICIYLFILYLFIYLYIYLFIYLLIYLFIYIFIYLFTYLFAYLYIYLLIYCLIIYLFTYLFI